MLDVPPRAQGRQPHRASTRGRPPTEPSNPKEAHEMKAITLNEPGTAPAVRDDLPTPTPGPREVLVRVQASSVNPVDNSIAAGMLANMGVEYEYPVTLGRDYAGVVEQVGADVTDYAPGDEVFGFLLHANPTARTAAGRNSSPSPPTPRSPAGRG